MYDIQILRSMSDEVEYARYLLRVVEVRRDKSATRIIQNVFHFLYVTPGSRKGIKRDQTFV